jgi:hypothetical protein
VVGEKKMSRKDRDKKRNEGNKRDNGSGKRQGGSRKGRGKSKGSSGQQSHQNKYDSRYEVGKAPRTSSDFGGSARRSGDNITKISRVLRGDRASLVLGTWRGHYTFPGEIYGGKVCGASYVIVDSENLTRDLKVMGYRGDITSLRGDESSGLCSLATDRLEDLGSIPREYLRKLVRERHAGTRQDVAKMAIFDYQSSRLALEGLTERGEKKIRGKFGPEISRSYGYDSKILFGLQDDQVVGTNAVDYLEARVGKVEVVRGELAPQRGY